MLGALTVRHSSRLSIVVLAASTGTAPATPSTVTPGSPPLDDRPGTLRTMAADGLGRPFTHRRLALAAIVAVGVFVRLWHINTLGYNSDEAVYGGQGASLADDPALKPFFPTFRAHPLLFQMLLSVGYHLGIGEIFGRLVSAALGIATVLIVFRVGEVLYGRKAGLIAALIIALMPYHVVVTRQVLLDGPMVLCATLSLLAVARYASTQRPIWLVTAGAAVGLTALTKEGSLVMVGSVYAFLAVSPEIKVRLRTIALAGAVMIAIVALFPMSLRLAGVTRTGGNYLAWQMFRRPNHDWLFYPSTVPQAMDGSWSRSRCSASWRSATRSHGGRSSCCAGSRCPSRSFNSGRSRGSSTCYRSRRRSLSSRRTPSSTCPMPGFPADWERGRACGLATGSSSQWPSP